LFLLIVVGKFALGTAAYFAGVSDDGGFGEILLMIAFQAQIICAAPSRSAPAAPPAPSPPQLTMPPAAPLRPATAADMRWRWWDYFRSQLILSHVDDAGPDTPRPPPPPMPFGEAPATPVPTPPAKHTR